MLAFGIFSKASRGSLPHYGASTIGLMHVDYGAISRDSVIVFERFVPLKNREGIQVFPATGARTLTVTVGVVCVITAGTIVTVEF